MKQKFLLNAIAGLIVLLSTLNFTTSHAQTGEIKKDHLGFLVSFGSRFNKVYSNYSAINNMKLVEGGGSAGLVWGKEMVETKITVGYYYSASNVPHTVNLFNVESFIRFYPLKAFTTGSQKVHPYLTTGLAANNYKLYGYYAGTESQANRSVSIEPYLGKITAYYGSVGAGIEINLLDQKDFVKLFSEISYHRSLFQKSTDLFNGTSVSDQIYINVGVSFGLNRFSDNSKAK